jgi:hypothetical protein
MYLVRCIAHVALWLRGVGLHSCTSYVARCLFRRRALYVAHCLLMLLHAHASTSTLRLLQEELAPSVIADVSAEHGPVPESQV